MATIEPLGGLMVNESYSADRAQEFDELYSISDLHMGGLNPEQQMFAAGTPLASLIDWLSNNSPDRRVGLVINGDFVDFLAEPNPKLFDIEGAGSKLNSIRSNASFNMVWDALGRFVKKPKRQLVIVLGNHDIELALPWMRLQLIEMIAGYNLQDQAQITLCCDGTGYRCKVGRSQVLCMHGNEVDTWNITDFEAIRQIVRERNYGRRTREWVPNGGAKLVIEVMNAIKRQFPFVDLLKPEAEAVFPVLAALNPAYVEKLNGLRAAYSRKIYDSLRQRAGLLEGEAPQGERAAQAPLAWSVPIDGEDLLAATERRLRDNVQPIELVTANGNEQILGVREWVQGWLPSNPRSDAVRLALKTLCDTTSFEWSRPDDTYHAIDKLVSDEINFVITGHTHIRRALQRQRKGSWYFNSGTWARLILLNSSDLSDSGRFAKIFQALSAGALQALDDLGGLVVQQNTVVAVKTSGNVTRGELLEWNDNRLMPVAPAAAFEHKIE